MGIVSGTAVVEKMKKVRLLVLDVDGVMTGGEIIYDDAGNESKAFDVKDGHGIKLLMRSGVDVAIVTARTSRVVKFRAENLGIKLVYQGMKEKGSALDDILIKTGLGTDEVGCMGDDIVDLPVLMRAGFSACPADAVSEVRERVDLVTRAAGGKGAVREAAEEILKAQGKWDDIIKSYLP